MNYRRDAGPEKKKRSDLNSTKGYDSRSAIEKGPASGFTVCP